jgi:hypothetical protein
VKKKNQLLAVIALAIFALAVGAPVQAGPPGSEYDANVFGTPVSASNGSTISMFGLVHFKLRNGRTQPDDVSGGGNFVITDPEGNMLLGDWLATQLEGFVVKGRCGDFPDCLAAGVPENFTAGKGSFKIHLDGVGSARFIMWCRLPGIPLPPFNAFPESYRVDIGSLHFDGQEEAGNFYVRTAE